jgi:hypothetical protein
MIVWLLMLLSLIASPIAPDDVLTVPLDGQTPLYFSFSGEAGQGVTIDLTQADDDNPLNNPVLALIGDAGVLVYNNDAHPDTRDAQITDFILPKTGDYWIFADTYGGIYAGELTLTLTVSDPFRAVVVESDNLTTITAQLPKSHVYAYEMALSAGEQVTITVQDQGRALDPIVWLYNEDGELLAWNDDHLNNDPIDLALDAFDAQIRDFVIPSDGTFTIRVSDFLGHSGQFILTIKQDR